VVESVGLLIRCMITSYRAMIVSIKPKVEEIKNLGNRNMLSQKSDIRIN